jgi:hypothetical protein
VSRFLPARSFVQHWIEVCINYSKLIPVFFYSQNALQEIQKRTQIRFFLGDSSEKSNVRLSLRSKNEANARSTFAGTDHAAKPHHSYASERLLFCVIAIKLLR